MWPGRSLPSIRPTAGWLPPGPGGPSASLLSPTAAISKRSPSSAGCSATTARRCTTTPRTWVWQISLLPRSAPIGGWKGATSSRTHSAASADRRLPGSSSSPPAPARGILADPSNSEAHFDKALADPAGDQWPFERAQLRLDHAEWLRRRRRINDAKAVLTEALRTFRRLGARAWAQRATTELRACGVAVTGAPADPNALGELTPQQRQIVRLASDGLTDREIGERLFLSPRTVSSHLYRSYPKLGVASRHQLRDVIAQAGPPAPAHEGTAGETPL